MKSKITKECFYKSMNYKVKQKRKPFDKKVKGITWLHQILTTLKPFRGLNKITADA